MINVQTLIDFAMEFCKTLPSQMGVPTCSQLEPVNGRWLDRYDGILKEKHGVYIISSLQNDVLYIGKADNSSIAQRIWSHVKTPNTARDSVPDRIGIEIYPNQRWEGDKRTSSEIIKFGDFFVYCLEIEPCTYASLVEVALHLFCLKNGGLPPFNKRIG
jgi:hypothetical protein